MKHLRISLVLLTSLLFSSPLFSQEDQIQSVVDNLYMRNLKTVNELVYLHTDREVYAPSDTVWFKAYIRNREKLESSNLSQTLFVKLVDDRGEIIDQGRFFIEDSDAKGQFTLDHKLSEGTYYITAYSSWMKNYDNNQLYKKKFMIRNEEKKGLQLVLSMDRNTYYPGDSILAFVHCFDELNRDVADIKYSYRVFAGKETFEKGTRRTLAIQHDTISFVLGDQLSGIPFISLSATHKGKSLDTTFRIPAIDGIDITFFPEGGHSIIGLESAIAFKAQTLHGEPIKIQGEIVTRDGQVISQIETVHEGMGSFRIIPSGEESLFCRITDPPGFNDLFPVPGGYEGGWQISGSSDNERINLDVYRKNTPGSIAVISVMVRGYLSFISKMEVDSTLFIEIPTADMPTGIGVVTLFDQEMQPRAERLFHINAGSEIGISMENDRDSYVPREKVRLDIQLDPRLADRLEGSYSLSIVDAPLGLTNSIDEPNIRAAFLLSPEIMGKIHNPNYYLNQNDSMVRNHFDLLLGTQGWRNYAPILETNWQDEHMVPMDQEIISGIMFYQAFGKDPAPSKGELNIYFAGASSKRRVDNTGKFMFRPEYDIKSNSGILISGNVKSSSKYVDLRMDQPEFDTNLKPFYRVLMDSIRDVSYVKASDYMSVADQFSLGLAYHEWIDEVTIVKSGKRPEIEEYDIVIEDFITQHKVTARPEYIESAIDVIGILYNMGIPVNYLPEEDVVEHIALPRSDIGWVVDDSYYGTNYSFVQNFVPKSIERFTVVKYTETMYYGANTPEVVVSIRLKTFDRDDPQMDEIQSKYNVPRFRVSKEFYNPKYETEQERASTLPDIRKTIHWDPDLKVGPDGRATIDFYNGDRYSNITCILEGISDDGTPVYSEQTYNVTLDGH